MESGSTRTEMTRRMLFVFGNVTAVTRRRICRDRMECPINLPRRGFARKRYRTFFNPGRGVRSGLLEHSREVRPARVGFQYALHLGLKLRENQFGIRRSVQRLEVEFHAEAVKFGQQRCLVAAEV